MNKKNPEHLKKGQAGYWISKLTDQQVETAKSHSRPLIRHLGYPADKGEPMQFSRNTGPINFASLKAEIIESQRMASADTVGWKKVRVSWKKILVYGRMFGRVGITFGRVGKTFGRVGRTFGRVGRMFGKVGRRFSSIEERSVKLEKHSPVLKKIRQSSKNIR